MDDTESYKSYSSKESDMSSLEQGRALEIERLISEGDWEGIAAVASKYEGGSDIESLRDSKQCTQDDVYFNSSTTLRSEVEALVRRVVPDEIGEILIF